jgi:hypothetical protein
VKVALAEIQRLKKELRQALDVAGRLLGDTSFFDPEKGGEE